MKFILILLIYQEKNKGFESYWEAIDSSLSVEEKVMKTRKVIKRKNGCENETLPIYSVLKLQVLRSEYLVARWTDIDCDLDPGQYGWKLGTDGTYSIQLQDESDPYFYLPKHLLLGCQCKNVCSKSCGCTKDQIRRTCSLAT